MKNIDFFINTYKTVYLAWATKYEGQPYINFGDELSIFINKKLFPSIDFSHCSFNSQKTRISSIGTILDSFYNGKTLVWGSGIDKKLINSYFDSKYFEVYAVRGKKTKEVLENFNIHVPEVFGDPAIFINDFVKQKSKKYKLGIIPHCSNYYVSENTLKTNTPCFQHSDNYNTKVISPKTKDNIESIIDEISSCETILSESIHGCIVADALNIPNLFLSKTKDESNQIISTSKVIELEHRYEDYISVIDIEKFQIIHDENKPLDYNKIYDLILEYYTSYDFSEMKNNLKNNHPLNF